MKKIHLGVLLFLFSIVNSSAQIFYGPTTTTSVAAQEVGEPGTANFGTVETATAPLGPDNRVNARAAYQTAGIPNAIIDMTRFLGNGTFARQISDMWAVKETGKNVRKVTSVSASLPAASSNVIYITTRAELDAQRNNIASNANFTFVFQGWINPGWPIRVGSNTTIWVDGTINYNGTDAVRTAFGAAFTPRPSKYDGVFNVRAEGVFKDEVGANFSVNQPNRDYNKALLKQKFDVGIVNFRIDNVKIYGTRRGEINIAMGNLSDSVGQTLPQVNGVTIMNASRVVIEGLTIKNALQGIYHANGSTTVNIRNNFIDNSLYRAIHLKQGKNPDNPNDDVILNPSWNIIENNLITNSKFDGIDVDSLAEDFVLRENVVIGARDRLLYWTEIDAKNNIIDNNVGILLDAATEGTPIGNAGKGAYQENGTENSRNQNHPDWDGETTFFKGNRDNQWTNNHAFYAESSSRGFDGFVMRKDRFILFNTITFRNNYVWTTDANITKHNPKYGVNNDVYYLTANNTSGSTFYIVNRETGKKIRTNGSTDFTNIELVPNSWTGNPTRWQMIDAGNGYFHLKNIENGKFFRPLSDNTSTTSDADGTPIVQVPNSWTGDFTKFKKVSTGATGNYFFLENKSTGMYFRPENGNDFSSIQQRPNSYTGNWTQWQFIDVNTGALVTKSPEDVIDTITSINYNSTTNKTISITPTVIESGQLVHINLGKSSMANVSIFDIQGSLVHQAQVNSTKSSINTNSTSGIYIVRIETETENFTQKFIVN